LHHFVSVGPHHSFSMRSRVRIAKSRAEVIRQAVGQWDFSAHDFSDEELVYCAQTMFEHAFTMPEVLGFVIPSGMSPLVVKCQGLHSKRSRPPH